MIRFRDGRFSVFTTQDGLPNNTTKALLKTAREASGSALMADWLDSRMAASPLTPREMVCRATTITVLQRDREGALGLGLPAGWCGSRTSRFTVYTTRDGLAHNVVKARASGSRGRALDRRLTQGLSRFKDGRFTAYGAQDGLDES